MKKNTMGHKAKTVVSKIMVSAFVWFLGIMMVVPFVWMLSTSFKGMNDVFNFPIEWIPNPFKTDGYKALFSGKIPFVQYFLNSVKVSAIALVGTFFSCTMAGYAYAKVKFSGRDRIFMLKLVTTMLPAMVTMLPSYIIYSRLGVLNNHASLWLGYFFGGTFGVFLMRQAFVTIPDSLVESARIDGASNFQIYWNVALPNVKGSVATLLFMYFLWSWNDYEKALIYLWDKKLFTLPLAVKAFSDDQMQNYPAIMAANVMMLLPIMTAFICCQKFFVESLVTSGVKG